MRKRLAVSTIYAILLCFCMSLPTAAEEASGTQVPPVLSPLRQMLEELYPEGLPESFPLPGEMAAEPAAAGESTGEQAAIITVNTDNSSSPDAASAEEEGNGEADLEAASENTSDTPDEDSSVSIKTAAGSEESLESDAGSPADDTDQEADDTADTDQAGTSNEVIFTTGDKYPKVIDHINYPNVYPDFSFSGEDDLLEVWFPSIRDQDAAIFLYQDQVWMVDCGDERAAEESVPLLRSLGVTQIDKLFNSHPHHDHLNGLYSIDAYFPIQELLICFAEDETKHMTAAMEYCKGNDITVTHFEDENVFSMGDGAVSFLTWQKTSEDESINDRSGQFMISYGNCNMLIMADMELHGQRQLYEALGPAPLKADILRYPHHGKMRMRDDVYLAIDPELVIITNGPRIAEIKQSTRFLDYKHANVAYTHRNEYILHLTTDGNHWLCEQVAFNSAAWMNPVIQTGTDAESSTSAPAIVTK